MAEQRRRSTRAKPAAGKGRAKSTGTRKRTSGAAKRSAAAKSSAPKSTGTKSKARKPAAGKSSAGKSAATKASKSTARKSSGAKSIARKPAGAKSPARKPRAPKPAPAAEPATLAELPPAIAAPEPAEPRPVLNGVDEARPVEPRRALDEPPRGRIPVFLGVALLAAAAAVAFILIISGGNDDNTSLNAGTTPTAVALTPNQTGKNQAKGPPPTAPAAKPATRTANCDPIIGSGTQNGGKAYAVTSTATDGDPASCGVAHTVLLSALNGGGSTIDGWQCTTQPNGTTVASCTSVGGRRIQAGG